MSRSPSLIRRVSGFALAALLPVTSALAHPGHDGDHGGGLTWDFVADVLHRLSSPYHLAPAVIVGLLALGIWRFARGKRDRIAKK